MRHIAMIVLTAAAMAPLSDAVHAKSCPLDAPKASLALWPEGLLKNGKTLTGLHACGKLLRCTGRKDDRDGRVCTWL